ncbi:MAG: DUF2318 domain-containing protein [Calditrichaeota bacterium]|nr:DUF2318 domain-containing protein [Calditrichota bacterium]MCB0266672.1 DUF2318 domain-containing protein [Calditrichota bacterium]MCB0285156.1 DUF2318 domain-containing protein [Calditrichota bacterium]MCB0301843.1 DUF2318 domain-containing protein [Calditrichota bacterium]MCB9067244.1 DUF2318 domain-containing protein [Calditrichia bacterium]
MANFCTQCGSAVQPIAKYCSECGAELLATDERTASEKQQVNYQDKRARVLGKNQHSAKTRKGLYLVVGVMVALGLFTFVNSLPSRSNPILENQPVVSGGEQYPASPTQMQPVQVKVENGKIILPLDLVKTQKFVAFDYQSPRGVVPLLAYISTEGKVVTAVSMCEPCKSTRFHIRSDQLYCNSCGTTWDLNNLSGISGACQDYPPDPLPSAVVGNEIHIDAAKVVEWVPRA